MKGNSVTGFMLDLHMNKICGKMVKKKLTGNQNLEAEVNWTRSFLVFITTCDTTWIFSMPHEQKYLSFKRLAFHSQK
jgi:hypothetical protein